MAFIQVFTEKIKGEKYKIKGNIAKCMTKCIPDGKITIELLEPRIQEWFRVFASSFIDRLSIGTHIGRVGCVVDTRHISDTSEFGLLKYEGHS